MESRPDPSSVGPTPAPDSGAPPPLGRRAHSSNLPFDPRSCPPPHFSPSRLPRPRSEQPRKMWQRRCRRGLAMALARARGRRRPNDGGQSTRGCRDKRESQQKVKARERLRLEPPAASRLEVQWGGKQRGDAPKASLRAASGRCSRKSSGGPRRLAPPSVGWAHVGGARDQARPACFDKMWLDVNMKSWLHSTYSRPALRPHFCWPVGRRTRGVADQAFQRSSRSAASRGPNLVEIKPKLLEIEFGSSGAKLEQCRPVFGPVGAKLGLHSEHVRGPRSEALVEQHNIG